MKACKVNIIAISKFGVYYFELLGPCRSQAISLSLASVSVSVSVHGPAYMCGITILQYV